MKAIAAMLAVILFISSCKKGEDVTINSNPAGLAENTYTIDGTPHIFSNGGGSNLTYQWYKTQEPQLNLHFYQTPADGEYTIVATGDSGAKNVYFSLVNRLVGTQLRNYFSKSAGQKLIVSHNDGKIRIGITPVWMQGSQSNDSIKISAYLVETP